MTKLRSIQILTAGLTIAVAVLSFLWWYGAQGSKGIHSPMEGASSSPSPSPIPSVISTSMASGQAPLLTQPDAQITAERQEASPRLQTRVRSANGQAITDGVAVWGAHLDNGGFWRGQLLALAKGQSRSLRTPIRDGQFTFPRDLDREAPSVLHVLVFDHLSAAEPIDDEGRFPAVITLEPTGPVVVQVRGTDGAPIADALVRSVGSVRIGSTADRQLINEEYLTDSDGRVSIYPLPGESILIAERGNDVSEPWVGKHARQAGPVLLELAPSFAVSGTVEGSLRGTDPSDHWVTASLAEEPWKSAPLGTLPVQPNGSFAGRISWQGDASYVFRLYGLDARPFEVREQVSDADATVQISFKLNAGHEATFLLLDGEDAPQADIPVAAVWQEDGEWLYYPATSDKDGLVSFHDCPATSMWVRTYSKRHVDKGYGPFMVSVETITVIDIVLDPVGRIEGRVLLNGEPAEAFKVVTWPEDPHDRIVYEFKSPEGRFEILDAPLGLVHLAALTKSHPLGPVQQVITSGEEVAKVELELNEAVTASGRVIDIATGGGIPGAEIQVWTTFESRLMDSWGSPIVTGSDGGFEGLLLSPVSNALSVTADGFERQWRILPEIEGTTPVLKTIGLALSQNLLVRLLGPAGMDYSGFMVATPYTEDRKPRSVDSSGEVVFEDTASGVCSLNVWTPDGERIAADIDLISGRQWLIEIPVSTERTVVVKVEPEAGKPLPEHLWVEADYLGPGGHTSSRVSPVEDDGKSTFHCISGDGAVFRAIDSAGVYYASQWETLADVPLEEVTLKLSGKSSRLLLLDSNEEPVTGTFALVMAPGDPLHDQFPVRTDSAGMVTLADYGSDVIYLMVSIGDETLAVTPPIHLDVDEDPIRVHLDSSATVAVRLEESGSPAALVRTDLGVPGVFASFRSATSDSEGMVRFQGLSETTYTLRVEGDGWWPSEYSVRASPDPPIQTIGVRRIGSITAEISRLGLPLPKAELRLTSLVDDLDISTWIEEQLVSTGPSGLISDLQGEVSVQGIPAGPYRWTVLVPGLAPLQGQIEVRPLEETVLLVGVE